MTKIKSEILIANAIELATKREESIMKYPCNNHSKFVAKMRDREYKDKSFELFVMYVLYNWGTSCTQLTIGANVATINGSDSDVFICTIYYLREVDFVKKVFIYEITKR